MLKTVEPVDQSSSLGRSSISSVLISVLFHALLAFIFYCVVFDVIRRRTTSLSLTGSATETSSDSVALNLAASEAPATPELPPSAESAFAPSTTAMEPVISESTDAETVSQTIEKEVEPASIDFFGTRAFGNRFVFVLDISYSMDARGGERFERAADELIRSVSQLRTDQSYFVFVFCWSTQNLFYDHSHQYVSAVDDHEKRIRRWVNDIRLGPGTDPRRALSLARRMDPDAIFLLSDGHFNQPRTPKSDTGWFDEHDVRSQLNVHDGIETFFRDLPIHTIAFENPFTFTAMERIAKATGGQGRYVKTRSLEPVDTQRFETALRHIKLNHGVSNATREAFQTRLSYARELVAAGELAYAEYLVRPLRNASPSMISNPVLLTQVLTILDRELGDVRLEDFESAEVLTGTSNQNQ